MGIVNRSNINLFLMLDVQSIQKNRNGIPISAAPGAMPELIKSEAWLVAVRKMVEVRHDKRGLPGLVHHLELAVARIDFLEQLETETMDRPDIHITQRGIIRQHFLQMLPYPEFKFSCRSLSDSKRDNGALRCFFLSQKGNPPGDHFRFAASCASENQQVAVAMSNGSLLIGGILLLHPRPRMRDRRMGTISSINLTGTAFPI